MSPAEYKAAIKELGLTQVKAGKWLGISPRQSQSYAIGEYPVPELVAKMLRLCVERKIPPEDVK